MTGRPGDGPSDWEGPEWAAPERAERLASRPRARRNGCDVALRLYAAGAIDGDEYQEMRAFETQLARNNRTRAVR